MRFEATGYSKMSKKNQKKSFPAISEEFVKSDLGNFVDAMVRNGVKRADACELL
jgi:hypothetical protein